MGVLAVAGLIAVFVLFSALAPSTAGTVIGVVNSGIIDSLGWYYTLLVAGLIVFALWMGLSRFGDIRLGKDGEEPEFGLRSWFACCSAPGWASAWSSGVSPSR